MKLLKTKQKNSQYQVTDRESNWVLAEYETDYLLQPIVMMHDVMRFVISVLDRTVKSRIITLDTCSIRLVSHQIEKCLM
jgi:hypothetical protein